MSWSDGFCPLDLSCGKFEGGGECGESYWGAWGEPEVALGDSCAVVGAGRVFSEGAVASSERGSKVISNFRRGAVVLEGLGRVQLEIESWMEVGRDAAGGAVE